MEETYIVKSTGRGVFFRLLFSMIFDSSGFGGLAIG